MKICCFCRVEVDEDAICCPRCGEYKGLEEVWTCSCGARNPSSADRCDDCDAPKGASKPSKPVAGPCDFCGETRPLVQGLCDSCWEERVEGDVLDSMRYCIAPTAGPWASLRKSISKEEKLQGPDAEGMMVCSLCGERKPEKSMYNTETCYDCCPE